MNIKEKSLQKQGIETILKKNWKEKKRDTVHLVAIEIIKIIKTVRDQSKNKVPL